MGAGSQKDETCCLHPPQADDLRAEGAVHNIDCSDLTMSSMNVFTLSLRRAHELAFWQACRRHLLLSDIASTVLIFVHVLVLDFNAASIFSWQLQQPMHFAYVAVLVSIKFIQLLLIWTQEQAYWRHRVWLNLAIRSFLSFRDVFLLTCIANYNGPEASTWLQHGSGPAYTLLILMTGSICGTVMSLTHIVPFRHMVWVQAFSTLVLVNSAWSPTAHMLLAHPKLAADAQWLCDTVLESMTIITGMGSAWQPADSAICLGTSAISRTVLMVQLMCNFFIPLLLIYILESKSKQAFLARLQPAECRGAAGHGAEWAGSTIYLAMLVGGILLCDFSVDVVHWLGLSPQLQ